jgi:hypothetical protein
MAIMEFPSYEEAMRNSEMPKTQGLAAGLRSPRGPAGLYNVDVAASTDDTA